jgi:hypothetical protein
MAIINGLINCFNGYDFTDGFLNCAVMRFIDSAPSIIGICKNEEFKTKFEEKAEKTAAMYHPQIISEESYNKYPPVINPPPEIEPKIGLIEAPPPITKPIETIPPDSKIEEIPIGAGRKDEECLIVEYRLCFKDSDLLSCTHANSFAEDWSLIHPDTWKDNPFKFVEDGSGRYNHRRGSMKTYTGFRITRFLIWGPNMYNHSNHFCYNDGFAWHVNSMTDGKLNGTIQVYGCPHDRVKDWTPKDFECLIAEYKIYFKDSNIFSCTHANSYTEDWSDIDPNNWKFNPMKISVSKNSKYSGYKDGAIKTYTGFRITRIEVTGPHMYNWTVIKFKDGFQWHLNSMTNGRLGGMILVYGCPYDRV